MYSVDTCTSVTHTHTQWHSRTLQVRTCRTSAYTRLWSYSQGPGRTCVRLGASSLPCPDGRQSRTASWRSKAGFQSCLWATCHFYMGWHTQDKYFSSHNHQPGIDGVPSVQFEPPLITVEATCASLPHLCAITKSRAAFSFDGEASTFLGSVTSKKCLALP